VPAEEHYCHPRKEDPIIINTSPIFNNLAHPTQMADQGEPLSGGNIQLSADSVSLVRHKLCLTNIGRETWPTCIRPILQIAFFDQNLDRFFSYTDTSYEASTSIILDEDSLSLFPENSLFTSSGWGAIEVYEGPDALNQTGIIKTLSEAVGSTGINFFYLSTFSTDLLLVEQEHAERARKRLVAELSSQTRSHGNRQEPQLRHTNKTKQPPPSSLHVSPLPHNLTLASLSHQHIFPFTHELLKFFLFPKSESRFFSFTLVAGQVTLVVEKDSFDLSSLMTQNLIAVSPETWCAFQVQDGGSQLEDLGSPESSVAKVTWLSSHLAQNNISIYYLSTFATDFILVPKSKVPAVLECLKEEAAVVIE